MARINVSVADGLKERMAALDQQVNWSEVAQAAFEREVTNRTFKGENMTEVVERLRASKAEFIRAQDARGRSDGVEWARKYAAYEDLSQIAKLEFHDAYGYAQQVDEALGNSVREGTSFWIDEDTGQPKYPSDEYVQAYVEGATSVWDEVEDQL